MLEAKSVSKTITTNSKEYVVMVSAKDDLVFEKYYISWSKGSCAVSISTKDRVHKQTTLHKHVFGQDVPTGRYWLHYGSVGEQLTFLFLPLLSHRYGH